MKGRGPPRDGFVQRILVIDNVGLWISLNRHFAGEGNVRVSDATTIQTGLRLAAVEQPEIIVCSSESIDRSLTDLSKLFREAGVDETKVVCVAEPDVLASAPRGLAMQICGLDRFIEIVDAIMSTALKPRSGVTVDLLAHFDRQGAQEGEEARGFVNLLEIDGTRFLIESTIELNLHEVIDLNFFLPRFEHLGKRHDRCQVSLCGEIRQAVDEEKLHYRYDARKIEKQSQEYLELFVESKRGNREDVR